MKISINNYSVATLACYSFFYSLSPTFSSIVKYFKFQVVPFKKNITILLALFIILLLLSNHSFALESELNQKTLILCNQNYKNSIKLAEYYALKRNIPRRHILPLNCSIEESISRDDYNKTILIPLRKFMTKNNLWQLKKAKNGVVSAKYNHIKILALMQGIPLKIKDSHKQRENETKKIKQSGVEYKILPNNASIDSEISLSGAPTYVKSGFIENPYFKKNISIKKINYPSLFLVGRIDSSSYALSKKLIDDALYAEKNGILGNVYIDLWKNNNQGYAIGDKWLNKSAKIFHENGYPIYIENGNDIYEEFFPFHKPSIYLGWYYKHCTGGISHPDFRFTKGAIACHIHSFSANTIRLSNSHWVTPLLEKGATAVLGNVYEPYLSQTHNLSLFSKYLMEGYTLIESAYMSIPSLSWMAICVGDPLYTPFKKNNVNMASNPWKLFQVLYLMNKGKKDSALENKIVKTFKQKNFPELLEFLGLHFLYKKNKKKAYYYFKKARKNYAKNEDIARNYYYKAKNEYQENNKIRAIPIFKKIIKKYPGTLAAKASKNFLPKPKIKSTSSKIK